jgi:hypothetical protein
VKLFLPLLFSGSLFAQTQIWIAPGPTHAGSGTLTGGGTASNPFSGDFDLILSNAPDHAELRLLSGVFWTQATSNLKEGQRLLGCGKDITIVRRDPAFNGAVNLSTMANNVEVSDLTADCNATGSEPYAIAGVHTGGNHETVRRVKVINPSGSGATGSECFAIFINDLSANKANKAYSGNLVTECEVAQVKGDYVCGVALLSQGVVEKCRVELPPYTGTNGYPMFNAYQATESVNATFMNNLAIGGYISLYSDSFWETNLTIAYNQFLGASQGINITKASTGIDGVTVVGNVVELSPLATASSPGAAIRLWGGAGMKNATVSGNLLRNPGQSPMDGITFRVYSNLANLKIIYNTLDTNLTITTGTPNCVFTGNTDTSGNLLTYSSLPLNSALAWPGSRYTNRTETPEVAWPRRPHNPKWQLPR